MGGARVHGMACWWCDIGNGLGDHVTMALGGSDESVLGYLRWVVFGSFLYPPLYYFSF